MPTLQVETSRCGLDLFMYFRGGKIDGLGNDSKWVRVELVIFLFEPKYGSRVGLTCKHFFVIFLNFLINN